METSQIFELQCREICHVVIKSCSTVESQGSSIQRLPVSSRNRTEILQKVYQEEMGNTGDGVT